MGKIDSTDAAALTEALAALDIESCAGVLVHIIETRPELAPVVVNACIPDLTYAPSAILTNRAQGTIKSFNDKGGFGFIASPEIQEVFGRDVFVHNKQFRAGGFPIGSAVSFGIVLNKDNHPQAFDISEASASEGMSGNGKGGASAAGGFGKGKPDFKVGYGGAFGGDAGCGKGGAAYGAGYGAGYGWMEQGKGKDAGKGKGPDIQQELGQGVGVLKSFNPSSGYGFIDCAEMKEMGYQDVFVHHAQIGNFTVGDEVVFMCFLNKKGQPQAMDLMSPQASIGAGAKGGKGGCKSAGKSGGKSKKPGEGHSPVAEILGTSTGTIKSYNDKSGYGFIDCPEVKDMGHNDVFLLHAMKGDFAVGEEIQFTAFVNDKGKVEAMDLQYPQEPAPKKRRV